MYKTAQAPENLWMSSVRHIHTTMGHRAIRYAGAVVLGIVMLVDAGYSGDWSRIGAISHDLEAELKGIAPLVGAFHLFCAPLAGAVALRRGLSAPKAVAKVSLDSGLRSQAVPYAVPLQPCMPLGTARQTHASVSSLKSPLSFRVSAGSAAQSCSGLLGPA